MYLKTDGDRIVDVAFTGQGCAISKSSASLMTASVKGKTVAEAEATFERFHRMVTGHATEADGEEMGKLAVFAGVREYPTRVKCASLAWHTLHAALHEADAPVTTEDDA